MASRAQSFNKILLTTSNNAENNILLQEISGALYVNDNPVAIESSGSDATSYIDSVVTKTEAGPIDKRSTDTTASTTNYYRVPVESLRFDDLEVGATYRINVSLLGYHGSSDLGASLDIRNRASSFSSDTNLDNAGINNYNNNGGDPDPAIISIASVGNDTTLYGETHSQTKIFEATGTHLDVLANSISSNSFFKNIIIQLEKITVGGGSITPQFCNVEGLNTTQNISHSTELKINFDGDLSTGSQNWRTYNTDLGANVIEPGESGYYNIHAGTQIEGITSNQSMTDVVYAVIYIKKYNKTSQTSTTILSKYIGKAAGSGTGWINLEPHVTQHNYYLAADEVLYASVFMWKLDNDNRESIEQKLSSSVNNTFIQVERSAVGTIDSGTGAYASNSIISDNLSFAYNFPDALLVPLSRNSGYQERIFPFFGIDNSTATSVSGVWSGGKIHYELSLGTERFILKFDNDTSGTFNTYTEVDDTYTTDVVWSEMSPATTNQPTLKEFIDANRAIYYK